MKAAVYPMVLAVFIECCDWNNGPDPSWQLEIAPEIVQETIAGQHCMLLVQVVKDDGGAGEVTLSATAPGATVSVEPASIQPGDVAEITVIPGPSNVGGELTVTVVGERDGAEHTLTTALQVVEGDLDDYQDSIGPAAEVHRDRFVSWLEANQPELGITKATEWESVVVTPNILVVTHHLFLSEEWEMHVYWHVMIQPYDWAKIDLRRRFAEANYSLGFEISSVSDQAEEPHAVTPTEYVWR